MTITANTVLIEATTLGNVAGWKSLLRHPDGTLIAIYPRFSPAQTRKAESTDNGLTWTVSQFMAPRLFNPSFSMSNGGKIGVGHTFSQPLFIEPNNPHITTEDNLTQESFPVADVQVRNSTAVDVSWSRLSNAAPVGVYIVADEPTSTRGVQVAFALPTAKDVFSVETVASHLGASEDIQRVALTVDAGGDPHVMYVVANAAGRSNLNTWYYSNRVTGSWSTPVAVHGLYPFDEGTGQANLAINESGLLFTFVEAPRSALDSTLIMWYCERSTGGTWSQTAVSPEVGGSNTGYISTADGGGSAWCASVDVAGSSGNTVLIQRTSSGTFDTSSPITNAGGQVHAGWEMTPRIGSSRKSQLSTGLHFVSNSRATGGVQGLHYIYTDAASFTPEEDEPSCEAEPSRSTQSTNDEGSSEATISLVPDLVFEVTERFTTNAMRMEKPYVVTLARQPATRRRFKLQFNNRNKTDRDSLFSTIETLDAIRGAFTFTHPVTDESVIACIIDPNFAATKVNPGVYVITFEAEELVNTS